MDVPSSISVIEQDRRITILEENAKRFDRDLREVKQEMTDGFRQVGGKLESLSGKIDSLILTQATQHGQVQGGWWMAARIGGVTTALLTLVLAAVKYFTGG